MLYKQKEWNLSKIKPVDIKKELVDIENKVNRLVGKRKLLTSKISSKQFISIVKDFEKLRKQTAKLGTYTSLKFSENAQDQKALAQMSMVSTALTKLGNKLLFFGLWFKKLPTPKANELIKAAGKYKYFFESMRKNRKYSLKENEEKIINIKDNTGANALSNLYDIFTSTFVFDFQGKKITREELTQHVRSSDPKIRKLTYTTLFKPYEQNKAVLGEFYKNIINDWREENVGLRGFKTPISVRNVANDVSDKSVETLLKVVRKNHNLFHKFFEVKRKKLGLKKLRRFDVYAPLKKENEKIEYYQAVKIVLDTFYGFSKEFGDGASAIINNDHVHSTIQKGKRSGAFCCTVSNDILPYVFLNYTKKYRDVSTLAHELGHGIHSVLAQKQTQFTHHSCLPLAETASIFSEMLLSEKMLKENPKAAKSMIFAKLDDIYASIIRQAGFIEFEIEAHEMMRQGKTIDEMSDKYLEMLKDQLGPKVDVDEVFKYEWAYIPHIFHSPFYCYAYAFGNLLTLALYEMYKEQGDKFTPKMVEMLSLGGSKAPVEIAKVVGADIESEKFWQKGFDVIGDMIAKLE